MADPPASLIDLGDASLPDGVTVDVGTPAPGVRHVRLHADRPLHGLATGWFAEPTVFVPVGLANSASEGTLVLGLSFTQFALPVVAGRALDFDFAPQHNLRSPPAVGLLLAHDGDRTTLLAPLTNVHEQIVAVRDGALRWGWHGDLDDVATGFETTLGVYDGRSATELLQRWAADLGGGTAPAMRRRDRNPITSHLSYWTDNGAAYWYRTEPGRTIAESVADAVNGLHAAGVPVHAVELDSWCYDHEIARPIAEIGYPEEVPPTGMLRWEPRADAFGTDHPDAIAQWAATIGSPPLAIHSRHISPNSPYVADGEWWVDLLAAQPTDPAFFARWFRDAQRWGVCCIEQDWMMMYWFGVRALRAAPGRAREWQATLDRLAGETGVGLLWCMATPADLILAAALPNVVAVRTSDDYRFAPDPAHLWEWYLTVNRLAAVLGLPAFKDVFFSRRPDPGDDPIDGDEHAELEALLAAMSAGPVGIGDRIGRTDAEIVLRTCDADGRIRHVDHPLGLLDACLFGAPGRGERLAWAATTATRDDAVWTYVVAINTARQPTTITDVCPLTDVDLTGAHDVYDWRAGTLTSANRLAATLPPRDWSLWVCIPPGHTLAEADTSKYVISPSGRL